MPHRKYKPQKKLSEKEFLEFINSDINEKQLAMILHGLFHDIKSMYSVEGLIQTWNDYVNKIVSCLGIQNISGLIRPQSDDKDEIFEHLMLQFQVHRKLYVIYFEKNPYGNWFFMCETQQDETYYYYNSKMWMYWYLTEVYMLPFFL